MIGGMNFLFFIVLDFDIDLILRMRERLWVVLWWRGSVINVLLMFMIFNRINVMLL